MPMHSPDIPAPTTITRTEGIARGRYLYHAGRELRDPHLADPVGPRALGDVRRELLERLRRVAGVDDPPQRVAALGARAEGALVAQRAVEALPRRPGDPALLGIVLVGQAVRRHASEPRAHGRRRL